MRDNGYKDKKVLDQPAQLNQYLFNSDYDNVIIII